MKDDLASEEILTKGCGACVNSKEAGIIVDRLLEEKDSLDRSDLESYISFHDRCVEILHPSHYVLNACRRWLIPLYCRPTRANADMRVTNEMLKRKEAMCEQYLAALERVEPGLTKNRGKAKLKFINTGCEI